MAEQEIIVDSLVAGPFATNLYIVGCGRTGKGAIIDAGSDAAGLLRLIEEHELELDKILQTHAHIDHVGGLNEVKERTGAPIYLHPDDGPMYKAAPQQAMFFGLQMQMLPPVDAWLEDGQEIEVGELRARVVHLPGHSPGSVCFFFEEQRVLFSGDVLFQGSIGRTDLPGSDPRAMQASLGRMLDEFGDDVRVLPGHMGETTMGRERASNPFLRMLR